MSDATAIFRISEIIKQAGMYPGIETVTARKVEKPRKRAMQALRQLVGDSLGTELDDNGDKAEKRSKDVLAKEASESHQPLLGMSAAQTARARIFGAFGHDPYGMGKEALDALGRYAGCKREALSAKNKA